MGTIRSASATLRTRKTRLQLSHVWLIIVTAALLSTGAAVSYAGPAKYELPKISGSVGGSDWRMKVFRRSEQSRDRPCLSVSLESEGVGKSTICGPFAPLPLMTGSTANRGVAKRFVLGMVFRPPIVRAKVWFRGRDPRNVHLRLLSKNHAREIGLVPLRYGATAFAGKSCLVRVAGYASSGRLVKPMVKIPCG